MLRKGATIKKCHFCDNDAYVEQNQQHANLCKQHYIQWKQRNKELKELLEE